jgi:hypothetical protein
MDKVTIEVLNNICEYWNLPCKNIYYELISFIIFFK